MPNRSPSLRFLFVLAPIAAAAWIGGCIVGDLDGGADDDRGGSSGPAPGVPCGDDPFRCAEGETCWPADDGARCVPSKDYKTKGEDCELLVGRSSCADDLVCITVQNPYDAGPVDPKKDTGPSPTSVPVSLCAPYCDDAHPCGPGETCTTTALAGFSARVCVPEGAIVPDGGVDAAPDAPKDTGPAVDAKPDTSTPDGDPGDADDSGGPDTSPPEDTGAPDTGPDDTGAPDTGPEDTGALDTGADDATTGD